MKGTIPLVARKGRASYLGERSAGHQDPGATSSFLLLKTVAETWSDGIGRQRTGTGRRPHMADYVGALDQGTTSTRFMIFDHSGSVVGVDQKEHEQIFPKPGWVEHDPKEVWTRSAGGDRRRAEEGRHRGERPRRGRHHEPARDGGGLGPQHGRARLQRARVAGHPPAGHRRFALADGDQNRFREKTGLPLATYFSGTKVRWILDNVDGARARAEAGDLVFGNMDTWCIWNLTGGTDGGVHVTDVTNACRTMLMNLETLDWDDDLCSAIGVPKSMLPQIRSSSEVYGEAKGTLAGISVAGDLGDQQAATFGQAAYDVGDAKNTYGTGCFMILNTGTDLVPSKSGLLTTVVLEARRRTGGLRARGLDRRSRARWCSGCATTWA